MTAPAAPGGVSEFQYPVPLFVHNTFIEAQTGRPASLEGFFLERQVFSCPGSCISDPGDELAPAAPRRTSYRPGQQLVQSAAFGSTAPLVLAVSEDGAAARVAAAGKRAAGTQTPEHDTRSECSTVCSSRAPPSPSQEGALVEEALPTWTMPFSKGLTNVPVLRLVEAISAPGPRAVEPLPSRGSDGHSVGQCKPCAFFHTKGCASGQDCQFCHLCPKGEKQRRQKEKREFFGTVRQFAQSWPFAQVQETQVF